MFPINDIHFSFLFLYAELHYRFFPFFPSLLYKKEPEVLFDAPSRLNPGEDLPVLLIINDIYRFPVQPSNIAITVSQPGNGTQRFDFKNISDYQIDHHLHNYQTAFLFIIPRDKIPDGELFINATVMLHDSKKEWIVFNDNLPGSSRRAFRCFRSNNALPGNELCAYGDLHVHSQFSQSHVEFGAPLAVIDRMAKCCGLQFIGITDHSYDLSCKLSNYLEEDQALERWRLLKNTLNDRTSFSTILIPGEELSCLNISGDTIHLVGLGHTDFLPGSRDGARKNQIYKKQLTVMQAIIKIQEQNGIAFAAHPGSKSGFLQRIFLHRGNWSLKDFNSFINGIQPLNSGFSRSWQRGKLLWIELLQQGLRIPLLAGNDAHGDFSRYRAIKTPFLSIYENFQRFMGYGKTGIYGKCSSQVDVFRQIKKGATFISTGPYVAINYSEDPSDFAIATSPKPMLNQKTLYLHAISTTEFGMLRTVTLFTGTTTAKAQSENVIFKKTLQQHSYEELVPVDCSNVPKGWYIRAEIESVTADGFINRGFTSAFFSD
jgi:hypothetical protein